MRNAFAFQFFSFAGACWAATTFEKLESEKNCSVRLLPMVIAMPELFSSWRDSFSFPHGGQGRRHMIALRKIVLSTRTRVGERSELSFEVKGFARKSKLSSVIFRRLILERSLEGLKVVIVKLVCWMEKSSKQLMKLQNNFFGERALNGSDDLIHGFRISFINLNFINKFLIKRL